MNLAIIPARSGSRRIPRKNFRDFHGRPILAYSVDAALASGLFDGGVWVSAEEQDWGHVGMAAPQAGWIRRYPEFARDEVGTQEVIRHALEVMEADQQRELAALGKRSRERPEYVCCIYPCAPMLTGVDLLEAWHMLNVEKVPFVYQPGQFYWGTAKAFETSLPLESGLELPPQERFVDVNTEEDWKRAEEMYAALKTPKSKEHSRNDRSEERGEQTVGKAARWLEARPHPESQRI